MTARAKSSRHTGPLAEQIRKNKEAILVEWTRRVVADRRVPRARELPSPVLRDDIPRLLDNLATALENHANGGKSKASHEELLAGYGDDRFHRGYTLGAALRELSNLRATLVDLHCNDARPPARDSVELLHEILDDIMSVAALEIARASRAEIEAGERRQRALAQEMREEVQMRERFLAIVMHDLGNPLAAIRFACALLVRHACDGGHRRAVDRITSSAERMTRMIDQLLDFTRMRSGEAVPVHVKRTRLRAICVDVIQELVASQPERQLVLEDSDDCEGIWDSDRLSQALSNLIANAIEYSTGDAPVRVTLRRSGSTVAIDINNRGTVISPDEAETIFEPFRRIARHGGAHKGLGLGLFIADQIVRAHGGAIRVKSDEATGTTFTMELPTLARAEGHLASAQL